MAAGDAGRIYGERCNYISAIWKWFHMSNNEKHYRSIVSLNWSQSENYV